LSVKVTFLSSAMLEAYDITALGENGITLSYGIENYNGSVARLRGGSYTGRGGGQASGVQNTFTSTLTAEGITALAENSSNENYGLRNHNTVTATVSGSSFTGRGGSNAYGISNELTVTLLADNVTALATDAITWNFGLCNVDNAVTTLHGGSLTGRGGSNAWGIFSSGSSSALEAEMITALAENSTSTSWGLHIFDGAETTLRGGSFTGRGQGDTRGIDNDGTLEASGITVLAENGGGGNHGLKNTSGATSIITLSVLDGTDEAISGSGTITVTNSRLEGGGTAVGVVCVAVSRGGTFIDSGSCP
jgi:hypothetical protein